MTGSPTIRNVDGVRTVATHREAPTAWCVDCPWTRDGADGGTWLAIRATARRHARISGHATRAAIRYTFDYAPDPRPELVP